MKQFWISLVYHDAAAATTFFAQPENAMYMLLDKNLVL